MSAAASKTVKFTSAFRIAGMNYLQALNAQTVALRKVLKEPLRTERMGKASFRFREFTYIDGKESAPGKVPCVRFKLQLRMLIRLYIYILIFSRILE